MEQAEKIPFGELSFGKKLGRIILMPLIIWVKIWQIMMTVEFIKWIFGQ